MPVKILKHEKCCYEFVCVALLTLAVLVASSQAVSLHVVSAPSRSWAETALMDLKGSGEVHRVDCSAVQGSNLPQALLSAIALVNGTLVIDVVDAWQLDQGGDGLAMGWHAKGCLHAIVQNNKPLCVHLQKCRAGPPSVAQPVH